MLFEFLVLQLNSNYAPVALLANLIFQARIAWKLKKEKIIQISLLICLTLNNLSFLRYPIAQAP